MTLEAYELGISCLVALGAGTGGFLLGCRTAKAHDDTITKAYWRGYDDCNGAAARAPGTVTWDEASKEIEDAWADEKAPT